MGSYTLCNFTYPKIKPITGPRSFSFSFHQHLVSSRNREREKEKEKNWCSHLERPCRLNIRLLASQATWLFLQIRGATKISTRLEPFPLTGPRPRRPACDGSLVLFRRQRDPAKQATAMRYVEKHVVLFVAWRERKRAALLFSSPRRSFSAIHDRSPATRLPCEPSYAAR